jgi:hypothetical protein
VRRVLYHLPEVLSWTGPVFLVEGEKDADNLIGRLQVATTSPGGADNWKPEYANSLIGKDVIVIPDKDAAGYRYAKEAIHSLQGKASSVKVVILPGDGVKDVSDWIVAGNHPDDLPAMAQDVSVILDPDKPSYLLLDDAITWRKIVADRVFVFSAERVAQERTGTHAMLFIVCDGTTLSWSYLNVEKREERSALATSAHGALKGDVTKAYAKEDLRRDLDSFCAGLWDFQVSRFKVEDMVGDENPAPLSFLLKPYVLHEAGTILFAPPGRGKSYTALLWAISVDAGCFKFWPTVKAKVLFINLERSKSSLQRRLTMVNRILGLPATRPLLTLNARGRTLADVMPALRKSIREQNVGMVVLDSISRAGVGDLNENISGNKVIDALSSLCPTWIALGHTSRANEEHMFGSIMQDAGADICVQLCSQVKQDGTLGIGWQITKQNDIGYQGMKVYALEFGEVGLKTFRPAKPAEFIEIEGKQSTDMETTIIDWIQDRDTGDASATEIEKELGYHRVTVSKFLNQSGRFVKTRKVKATQYFGVVV